LNLAPYLSSRDPDANGWQAEEELKSKLSQAGVELASGLGYKAETPGWFRVIFTVETEILEEGLRR